VVNRESSILRTFNKSPYHSRSTVDFHFGRFGHSEVSEWLQALHLEELNRSLEPFPFQHPGKWRWICAQPSCSCPAGAPMCWCGPSQLALVGIGRRQSGWLGPGGAAVGGRTRSGYHKNRTDFTPQPSARIARRDQRCTRAKLRRIPHVVSKDCTAGFFRLPPRALIEQRSSTCIDFESKPPLPTPHLSAQWRQRNLRCRLTPCNHVGSAAHLCSGTILVPARKAGTVSGQAANEARKARAWCSLEAAAELLAA
jgi:hypothetical protein